MKNIFFLLLVTLLGAGLSNAQSQFELKGPYLGQESPGDTGAVFAPDFISTDAGELNSVFCCNGNEFYFSRRGIPGKPSVLMVSQRTNDIWSEPQPLEFSGIYSDIDLYIAHDGGSLIFCSTRPHHKGDAEKADHDLWIAKRYGNAWSEPEPFAPGAMSEYEDFYPVLAASGNLYFNSQRGGRGGNNIYCSHFIDGNYSEAIMLPAPINTEHWEFDAFLTRDENTIVFSSTRPGGYGGADIYVSRKEPDGSWSDPRNLGPAVNSASYEYGASISPDGKYLFYTSSRNGSEDIFWVSSDVLNKDPADTPPQEAIDYGEVFMNHLRKNWEDIHDVIMRYHYEDPWLEGKVLINMSWKQGTLESDDILENTTGNELLANDLVTVLKSWEINEFAGTWSSALPIQTTIKGSEDPDFTEYGILTGKILDKDGKPLSGAGLVLVSTDKTSRKPRAVHTNREGIFIETLIPPGKWQISCNIDGYVPIVLEDILIEKGKHCKQDIIVKEIYPGIEQADSPDNKLKDAAMEIMTSANTCALISLDREGRPRVRAMDPFPPEADFTIWLGTNSNSRKVDQIKNDPRVTLYYLEDDASGYVMIHGTAYLVNDPGEKDKRWKKEWEAFYPENRETYLLIKIVPEWMEVVSYPHGITGDPVSWEPAKIIFNPK
ncbi:MAG: pyridoxamine 5'-phosphate oxidase family protein [Bacteroidales bacterium]|nr:pyridoxamine 5'-phosphate oxidase family protein [Bacteroidales bacterium]